MSTTLASAAACPPARPMTCKRCHRPEGLHCPGCGTCWPDHMCAPTCDAEPEEVAAAAAEIEEWETAREKLAAMPALVNRDWSGPGDLLYRRPAERADEPHTPPLMVTLIKDPCGPLCWHHTEPGDDSERAMRWNRWVPTVRFGGES